MSGLLQDVTVKDAATYYVSKTDMFHFPMGTISGAAFREYYGIKEPSRVGDELPELGTYHSSTGRVLSAATREYFGIQLDADKGYDPYDKDWAI